MSKNAIGIVILILSFAGVNLAPEMVSSLVSSSATVFSICLFIWHQLERSDIKGFFWKKE